LDFHDWFCEPPVEKLEMVIFGGTVSEARTTATWPVHVRAKQLSIVRAMGKKPAHGSGSDQSGSSTARQRHCSAQHGRSTATVQAAAGQRQLVRRRRRWR